MYSRQSYMQTKHKQKRSSRRSDEAGAALPPDHPAQALQVVVDCVRLLALAHLRANMMDERARWSSNAGGEQVLAAACFRSLCTMVCTQHPAYVSQPQAPAARCRGSPPLSCSL